jgi:phosphohistidine phosphatase
MKTLFILRHGKSDWSDASLSDFERPLTGRGKKDARAVGDFIASLGEKPDLLLASPAERARETAEIVAGRLSLPERKILWDKSLYEGAADTLIGVLVSLSGDIETLLVVGHNPALEHAAVTLLFGGTKIEDPVASIRIPTAGLLCLESDAPDWKSLGSDNCVLRWMITPKIIK